MKLYQMTSAAAILLSLSAPAFAQTGPILADDEVITTGQYLYSDRVNALKTPTPILDVPQSLSITTAEQILQQGFDSISDIVLYTPGLNQSQGEGHRDSVVFRGVRSTADFFVDGVRDDVQYYRSLYNLEQVEVLRGPNALFFGRGGTGGVINRVTKKGVIDETFLGYQGGIDTFGAYSASLDVNETLGDTTALRVNIALEELNNHRDFFGGTRFALNPTLRFEVSPKTMLDVSYEYNNNERFIDRGIPSAAPDGTTNITSGLRTPIESLADVTFGDETLNTAQFEAHVLRANVSHILGNDAKINLTAVYGDYDKLYRNLFPVGYSASNAGFGGIETVNLDGYVDTTQRKSLTLAGNVVHEFESGQFGHSFVAGAEYIDTSNNNDRFNTFFDTSADDVEIFAVARPINILGGIGVNAAGVATTNSFTVSTADDDEVDLTVFSAYFQDEIAVMDWLDIVVGARFDSFDFTVVNELAALDSDTRSLSSQNEEISPRLGLILKPRENISIYGSFSESFLPQSGEQFAEINDDEAALDPDESRNLEAGVKWDFARGLSFTAAAFQVETTDLSPDGDADNGVSEDVIQVEGIEASLSGTVTEQLSIIAGISVLDANIKGSDATPREIPEFTASAWGHYDITKKFGLGLGVTHQGESFADNGNTTLLPSFTRVDAAAYYNVHDNLRLQINVENLTDTDYFPSAHTDDQITVGAPLNAKFTISGRF